MQLSSFEMIKKGLSTIIEVVDAFARRELVRVENLINNLATVARTGSYNDLTDKPTIPVIPDISQVGLTGENSDLLNKPTLFSGDYNDLTNKPTLFSGNYNDLTNKPTIPSKTSQLQNDSGYVPKFDFGNNGEKLLMAKDSEWHFGIVMPNGDIGQLYFNDTGIGLATYDALTQQWVVKWFK